MLQLTKDEQSEIGCPSLRSQIVTIKNDTASFSGYLNWMSQFATSISEGIY